MGGRLAMWFGATVNEVDPRLTGGTDGDRTSTDVRSPFRVASTGVA
jgi:hypothetical protein